MSQAGGHPAAPSAPLPPQATSVRLAPVVAVMTPNGASLNGADHNGTSLHGTGANGSAQNGSAQNGAGRNGSGPGGHAADSGQPTAGDGVEDRLTAIWADAIGDPEIGLDADFFEVGGNSLTAVSLMSHITEAFGVDLSLATLFDHPTIRGLGQALRLQGPVNHLVPLDADWALWRIGAVRGAGLPFDWLNWFADEADGPSLLLAEPAFLAALTWQNPQIVRAWAGASRREDHRVPRQGGGPLRPAVLREEREHRLLRGGRLGFARRPRTGP